MARRPRSHDEAERDKLWKLWLRNPPSENLFMKLPPKLRNLIYAYVLDPDNQAEYAPDGWPWYAFYQPVKLSMRGKWKRPGLLRTSKQIRQEALPMCYAFSRFRHVVKLKQLAGIDTWLKTISPSWITKRDAEPSQRFEIKVQIFDRSDIAHLLPVAHMAAADYPVEIITGGQKWGSKMREAIHEIQDLGRDAESEGWSEDWLEFKFCELLEAKLEILGLSKSRGMPQKCKRRVLRRMPGDSYATSDVGDGFKRRHRATGRSARPMTMKTRSMV